MKKLMKTIVNKVLDITFYRKRTTDYWWGLFKKAKARGTFAIFSTFRYLKYTDKYNSFIPIETVFAGKPIFPHGIRGVFISSGAVIGCNSVIFQHVTIGSNTLADSKMAGSPTIGNNVYIGTGAKIIGRITIGNNVRIGAGCVVVNDIPDNCVVVSQKPRVIMKEGMDNTFYDLKDV